MSWQHQRPLQSSHFWWVQHFPTWMFLPHLPAELELFMDRQTVFSTLNCWIVDLVVELPEVFLGIDHSGRWPCSDSQLGIFFSEPCWKSTWVASAYNHDLSIRFVGIQACDEISKICQSLLGREILEIIHLKVSIRYGFSIKSVFKSNEFCFVACTNLEREKSVISNAACVVYSPQMYKKIGK